MISYCRNILVFKSAAHPEEYLDLTESEKKQIKEDMAVQEAVTFLAENAVEK